MPHPRKGQDTLPVPPAFSSERPPYSIIMFLCFYVSIEVHTYAFISPELLDCHGNTIARDSVHFPPWRRTDGGSGGKAGRRPTAAVGAKDRLRCPYLLPSEPDSPFTSKERDFCKKSLGQVRLKHAASAAQVRSATFMGTADDPCASRSASTTLHKGS